MINKYSIGQNVLIWDRKSSEDRISYGKIIGMHINDGEMEYNFKYERGAIYERHVFDSLEKLLIFISDYHKERIINELFHLEKNLHTAFATEKSMKDGGR